ncbi:hypothetical protein ACA910_004129 [Epithemia clementina (nom. ined.)]
MIPNSFKTNHYSLLILPLVTVMINAPLVATLPSFKEVLWTSPVLSQHPSPFHLQNLNPTLLPLPPWLPNTFAMPFVISNMAPLITLLPSASSLTLPLPSSSYRMNEIPNAPVMLNADGSSLTKPSAMAILLSFTLTANFTNLPILAPRTKALFKIPINFSLSRLLFRLRNLDNSHYARIERG